MAQVRRVLAPARRPGAAREASRIAAGKPGDQLASGDHLPWRVAGEVLLAQELDLAPGRRDRRRVAFGGAPPRVGHSHRGQRRALDCPQLGQRLVGAGYPAVAEHGRKRELEALEVAALGAEHGAQGKSRVLARTGIDRLQAAHAGEDLPHPDPGALCAHRHRELAQTSDDRVAQERK